MTQVKAIVVKVLSKIKNNNMTEQEIEIEVQARIEFKMNELLDGIKNRVKHKYGQAFDMTQKSQHIWEAWQEFEQMFAKEVKMPPPYDEMAKRKMWEAKEKAVDTIVKSLDLKARHDYPIKVRTIANEIERAQHY